MANTHVVVDEDFHLASDTLAPSSIFHYKRSSPPKQQHFPSPHIETHAQKTLQAAFPQLNLHQQVEHVRTHPPVPAAGSHLNDVEQ